MANDFEKLSQLIQAFERTDFLDEQYKFQIQSLAKKKVDWYLVENYYKGISLEDLCQILLTPNIENWQTLTDDECLNLIQEILDVVCNVAIVDRNMDALHKRYPNLSVCDLIFWQDETNPKVILERLKNS
ncbi:hypothetical protein LP123_08715 [Moraxella bovis]|uniref:Uncharacterized protein n=1 Tax=Moraxella bovis TaxID=476 RepID=A0AAQ2Q0C3_MORBO|nr:hypothetical protein [Moraxella bovis]UYZ76754.1 hypothetical protein LP093_05550 [Moraxella bovis]UYZ77294.1 hypothetical protein LP115_08270 [Moraxella bovis]UYZ82228.1 hypothetical protein LP113_05875 [Moraxella bovis]UYZ85780.1 hypothetical protein LP094_08315 [Moraxella bovis]UYZ88431.1 hypothetical protein LP114_08110 [Moraxella bovis]